MKRYKFSELFKFQKKSKIKAGEGLKVGGKYPFYTSSDTLSKSINTYLFNDESLIFGTVGQASVHYCETPFAVSTDCLVAQPKNNKKLLAKYAYYYLFSSMHILERGFKGAGLKHISKSYIEDILIPIPDSIETQRHIAYVLDKADAVRQKRRESIELLDKLLRDSFLEMFGEPREENYQWKLEKLEKHLSFLTSGSRGWAKYYSNEGEIFIRIQNVGKNRLLLNDITCVNAPISAESKRTKVEQRDVLISITADIGRSAVIPSDFEKTAFINQHLAILRLKKSLNPFFLSAFISSEIVATQFSKFDKGGVKAGLNFKDIKSILVPIPPKSLQDKYEDIFLSIEKQRKVQSNYLSEAENLFNSLLQRAFKGELEIEKDVYDVLTTGTINPNQDKESVNVVIRMIENFEAAQQQLKQQGAILSQSLQQVSKQMQQLSDEWTKNINVITKQSSISAAIEQMRMVGEQLKKEHFKIYYAFSDEIETYFPNLERMLKELNKPMDKEQIQKVIYQTFEEKGQFSFEELNKATENFNVAYDTLKNYLFESVENETLQQVFEIDDNRTLGNTGTDNSRIIFKLTKSNEA